MPASSSPEESPPHLPSVSVVVPCFNAEATLADQLGALSIQSWDGEWEVVVADNGSTDGSRQVAESFGDRLPRLTVVDASQRRGPGHARNRGAELATGEILLFTDADDEVGEGWIEAMTLAVADNDFVASRYDVEKLNPSWVSGARRLPQEHGLNPYIYPPFLSHAGGGGLGVTRSLHRSVGGFDESLEALEDTDYCWRLQLEGHPLHFAPEAVVHIRLRHTLPGIFRQLYNYGIHNVEIYTRYRDRGMPRLPLTAGAARWAKLLLTAPKLLSRQGRVDWISQLGWRLGRLRGCIIYRTLAP